VTLSAPEYLRRDSSSVLVAREPAESLAWAMLHSMPDGVVMIEDGGRIVFANRRAESLFGYSRGELLGENIEILIAPAGRDAHRDHRARYGEAPIPRPMGDGARLLGVRRDGSGLPVDVSLSPLVEGSRRLIMAAVRPHSDLERDRIASELLESVIGQLFSVGWSLQEAIDCREDTLTERLAQAIDALDTAIHQIRAAVYPPNGIPIGPT
jgi:PAS domain S-box-containing protein